MAQRERESVSEPDPHALLFGTEDDLVEPFDAPGGHGAYPPGAVPAEPRPTRSSRHRRSPDALRRRRARRRGRLVVLLAIVLVGVVGMVGYRYVRDAVMVKDFSGTGTTPVTISIVSGDSASTIAQRLVDAGVVRSVKAFTKAAEQDSDSQNIQPGTYTLRRHMSGENALALLLDPGSRSATSDVVVTEGANTFEVSERLAKALGEPVSRVRAAMDDLGELNLPSTYTVRDGGAPTSVEGFLYPATYVVDPGSDPTAVLTKMINKFVEEDRSTGFAGKAKALRLTPYDALIIASIAQAEARFPEDMPKVARVILNRMALKMPLQIDATSVYGAEVLGLDPKKTTYSELDSPYNGYRNRGLPPTPISNPGEEALLGAVNPADGDWRYYVNGDKAGHLFFTNSESEFAAAVAKCRDNNWGCA